MQSFGLQMRSTLLPGQPWDVMVDLFFYREPEETKDPSEEEAADYGGDAQPYGQLPAPGGELFSICHHLLLACDQQNSFRQTLYSSTSPIQLVSWLKKHDAQLDATGEAMFSCQGLV